MNKNNRITDKEKGNSFKNFLYNVFVKHLPYKLLALGIAATIWILCVGFGL